MKTIPTTTAILAAFALTMTLASCSPNSDEAPALAPSSNEVAETAEPAQQPSGAPVEIDGVFQLQELDYNDVVPIKGNKFTIEVGDEFSARTNVKSVDVSYSLDEIKADNCVVVTLNYTFDDDAIPEIAYENFLKRYPNVIEALPYADYAQEPVAESEIYASDDLAVVKNVWCNPTGESPYAGVSVPLPFAEADATGSGVPIIVPLRYSENNYPEAPFYITNM